MKEGVAFLQRIHIASSLSLLLLGAAVAACGGKGANAAVNCGGMC